RELQRQRVEVVVQLLDATRTDDCTSNARLGEHPGKRYPGHADAMARRHWLDGIDHAPAMLGLDGWKVNVGSARSVGGGVVAVDLPGQKPPGQRTPGHY